MVRAYGRYTSDGGNRLAASATYFAFLSFFPIIVLMFAIIGFIVDAYPDLQEKLIDQINDYLPGLADKLDIASIGRAKVGAGLIGLAGLVLAGLAWIDALRDGIRILWHQNVDVGNILIRRLKDLGVLVGLGVMLLASVLITSFATSATGAFLEWVGLADSTVAAWATGALAVVLALAIDTAVFLYLFWRLPQRSDRGRVLRGALLGAVGIELLKIAGTWLVGETTSNPVYGTFAVMVGLLIWINVVMRWVLFIAAWTVTAPFSSDVHPSGTAGVSADTPRSAETPQPTDTGTVEGVGGDRPESRSAPAGDR